MCSESTAKHTSHTCYVVAYVMLLRMLCCILTLPKNHKNQKNKI